MQVMRTDESGLGILCRMPTEDPRAGPQLIGQPPKGKRFDVQKKRQLAAGLQVLCRTCTLLLHIEAPSSWGPADRVMVSVSWNGSYCEYT